MARYALVVGISEYKSTHLDNLSKPVGDAEAIASLIQKYGQCDQEPTVLKGKVTTGQLVKTLKTFLNEQAVNNEAIIYFTGHGVSVKDSLDESQGYLATSDCEVTVSGTQPVAQQNAIPFSSLNSLIQKAKLSNLILLMDACHSGEFIERTLVEQSFSVFSAKQDHCLITACRGFESSWAKKSDDHSVFTQAVLSALVPENADAEGCITGDRLFDHLSNALKGSRQEAVRYSKGRSLSVVKFPSDLLSEKAPRTASSEAAVRRSRLPTVPLQMPPLPDHFVERPEQQAVLKAELLCESAKVGTLVVSAIYGLGGIGKSVLASKLTHDRDVQQHFADGILWATLGQSPDILPLLSGWIQALGDRDYKPTAIESASNHLRTLLYDKRTLLVVDDVWNPDHLEPFRVGGERSCVLVTTREARIPEARPYALDVMEPEQALELMTQKLSAPLSEVARQQALDFAARVGYLPLALELAASQIEEGVTWQELLEDFQAEFARLETLDIYGQEEKPEDEKRRKYSLLACFNLSLKQLSIEQLRQFAWLGVMPEDVSMTQGMAETLWQVTVRQSGSILRTFRAKSLVLQGASQADERLSYRMHDLMHDMAQRLLVSPPLPVREGELSGLGLTKAEAHSQLLERYRAQTRNGEWHTLVDDGYIYAHLTWHMEQAKQPQALHQLLRASNEEGRNGWYEACDAIGQPAGFVNDMGRAWQLAVADYEQAPGESVALLFRYALMRTSLNSLASNVPAELVGALVKNGVWQAAQGLAYAQQAQNPWQRAECISAIVPYVPKALLPEVLKTVGQIKDAAYRSYVLSKLAECFPELWPDVLAAIQQIQDRYDNHRNQTKGFSHRALAISSVIKHLPTHYLDEVIAITRRIQEPSDQSMALEELVKRRDELWSETLEVVRGIKDEDNRSRVLIDLVHHLPSELWPDALAMTRKIKDEDSRARVLGSLAKHLPKLWPEALAMTQEIKGENARSRTLIVLAKHLPSELWPEAIAMTRKIKGESARAQALGALAKHLPELWPEALAMTQEIEGENTRSRVLGMLARHLPSELWPEALAITKAIKDEHYHVRALGTLARHLPELWPEVLAVTQEIKSEFRRTSALGELVGHLPSELWPEALLVTREIKDKNALSSVLRALAGHLPSGLLPEVLVMTREIKDESSRSSTLRKLAKYLPELWPEALAVTREIKNENARSRALVSLAEHLPKLWPEALAVTREIKDENARSGTLGWLTENLPSELWAEALAMTREIKDEYARSVVLGWLAENLPFELWAEALAMTREITDEYARSMALLSLAKHLPELCTEALVVIREIKNEHARASALGQLSQYLPELWPEALAMIREIEEEMPRATALINLIEYLPVELFPEALAMTREFKDIFNRSWVLTSLAEHLPSELLPEALVMTQEIKDEDVRAHTLSALANHLPELWPETLAVTQEIKDENARSQSLRALAEHLPAELWPKALAMTREIKDEDSYSSSLKEMAIHLPSSLLSEAVEIVWLIQDKYYCANALQGFIPYLETLSTPFPGWIRVLDTLAYQNRSSLLEALPDSRATVIRLGGNQAFSEILQAVRDVCQQWP